MPKRRRKLSPELEKKIGYIKKDVELVVAKINDIDEEELQLEFQQAFEPVKLAYGYLRLQYDETGFTEETETALSNYQKLLDKFRLEYEV